ncbi:MAG: hypothetical protein CMO43_12820, partial [Verrucomicrobiales bacterium]|nr:hypothetical protein [Verrucomicrobiales bacterium]
MLTEAQVQQFEAEGYLALGQVAPDDQLAKLQQRLDDLTLGSLHNERIQYQIEPAMRDKMGAPKGYAYLGPSAHYRKLAQLDQDPLFLEYFAHPTFQSLLKQLIGPDITISRAFALLKPAFDGSPLVWHQDAGPGHPAEPGRFCTIWTAMDEAQVENGALEILPGTQELGLLLHRKQDGGSQIQDEADKRQGQEVPLPAKPGVAYLLNNYALHRSGPNPTPPRRRAMT